jgi:hypothetical protein
VEQSWLVFLYLVVLGHFCPQLGYKLDILGFIEVYALALVHLFYLQLSLIVFIMSLYGTRNLSILVENVEILRRGLVIFVAIVSLKNMVLRIKLSHLLVEVGVMERVIMVKEKVRIG